jgi:hypothetical protein
MSFFFSNSEETSESINMEWFVRNDMEQFEKYDDHDGNYYEVCLLGGVDPDSYFPSKIKCFEKILKRWKKDKKKYSSEEIISLEKCIEKLKIIYASLDK